MTQPPRLAPREIVGSGLCIGCGACARMARTEPAGMSFDGYGQFKPSGDPGWMRHRSATFANLCPFSPHAADEDEIAVERFGPDAPRDPRLGRWRGAYVGSASEPWRAGGSSGGLVSWTAAELLRTGRVDAVAHVAGDGRPDGDTPMYAYRLSRSEAELRAGARSRYYPVEMSAVLGLIRATPGRYAVIGLPCFIKAVHLARRADPVLCDRISWTLGLFCGHMKSARMADSFAWQMGVSTQAVARLDYRIKDETRAANCYTAEADLFSGGTRRRDWSDLVDGDWGAGFFQNSACDFCDDVMAETADIAFGDAWAEPYASDGRGTNVVVVRDAELDAMLRQGIAEGRLALQACGADFIAHTQAAGLRQRRDGLAYRLTWPRRGLQPRKRIAPRREPSARRRRIYRMRFLTSRWSHRIMWIACVTHRPGLYLLWARLALAAYHSAAYGRGRLGRWIDVYDRLRGRDTLLPPGPA